MRRKNTFYKATALAMTSVLTLGAPVIAHAENTEGTDLSDEGYPEINPEIATLENQELEIWLPADQGQDPNFQTVKEKFEESYPNITINYNTSIPWEEMPSKVKLAVNSGAAPDLALHHSFVAGAQGFAEPLDDLWEKWGAEDEFMESSLQDCTWNNVKYITKICIKKPALQKLRQHWKSSVKCPKNLPILQKVSMVLHATQIHGDYSELLLQKATI